MRMGAARSVVRVRTTSPHFASLVPRGRHLIETAMGCGKRWEVGERTRARGLPGPLDIHDHILLVAPIPQAADRGEWGACHQIFLKLRAPCLHRCLIKGGEKTRAGRTIRQTMALKECHEDVCKGGKPLIKGLEGTFEASGIPQKHDHEIHRVVRPETCARKWHMLLDGFQQPDMGQDLSESCHFSHPGRG